MTPGITLSVSFSLHMSISPIPWSLCLVISSILNYNSGKVTLCKGFTANVLNMYKFTFNQVIHFSGIMNYLYSGNALFSPIFILLMTSRPILLST